MKAKTNAKLAGTNGSTGSFMASLGSTKFTASLIEEPSELTPMAAIILNHAKGFSFSGMPKTETMVSCFVLLFCHPIHNYHADCATM